ncbi:MAG: phosphate acyltransferase PlsX [Kangiellaceae bacterium]|nr:phosphate acyltransferase PlsX [Kangiellaceae bacterium]
MANITIAIDCMGGDFGPSVTIPAIKYVLDNRTKEKPATGDTVDFQLFGQLENIESELNTLKFNDRTKISLHQSDDDVLMTDKPSLALKNKKSSSMRLALESVRDGRAHACVSAGNTGALMAVSRFVLKMLPGIDRPAIISALPTSKNGQVYLLDLGANVECNEKRLAQFAIMGNELCKGLDGVNSPKVGLLNVGEEEIKGSQKLRQAAALINKLDDVEYIGFVEGNQIFSGDYQVIVTDGFTGNNVLKASEGLSEFLLEKIKHAFQRNWWTKLIGLLAKPMLNLFKDEINPERYNGACLIGLRGVVIKSHGSANVHATVCAIEEAILQAKQKVPSKIRASLESAQINLQRVQ